MGDTKIGKLSGASVSSGIPDFIRDPIRPEKFGGRHQAHLAKAVGISQFGVNHVVLEPGMWSALRHWHECEDEFVYVLSGVVTLVDDNGKHVLEAGGFAGFPAGSSNAHHLVNESEQPAAYIAVGSRREHETVHYPDDDLGPMKR
ncbi:MAG: cupin domain-containing protein [Pseudomonadales bacterium]|jgi:uncharacterized cupin superfamily protein